MQKHWNNQFYGGSVLDPIYPPLQKDPVLNYFNGTFGDISREQSHTSKYYTFENIELKNSNHSQIFADIWILANTATFTAEDNRLVSAEATNIKEIGPIKKHRTILLTEMSKIQTLLNGYARIIIYEAHTPMNSTYLPDPKIEYDPRVNYHKNKILEIREGQFFNGMLNGYGRVFESDGSAKIGFFHFDKDFGKMMFFENGFLLKEGIVHSNGEFQKMKITDFIINAVYP